MFDAVLSQIDDPNLIRCDDKTSTKSISDEICGILIHVFILYVYITTALFTIWAESKFTKSHSLSLIGKE